MSPLPVHEQERRWAAVREAMRERDLDVLLVHGNNDFMGGAVRYLTGLPATNGYPVSVVFPRDEDMVLVMQGPLGAHQDAPRRGVKRIRTTASWVNTAFTRDYDAELVNDELKAYAGAKVGLAGSAIPYVLVDYLRRHALERAVMEDASDLLERIMARKSPGEIDLIRRTAALQDTTMQAAVDAAEPGRREVDVVAAAEACARRLGSEQGLFLSASGPVGAPLKMHGRIGQERVLEKGDQLALLVEVNGPGGFYAELGRTIVLGRASGEMREEFGFVLRARALTLELLSPQATCPGIWNRYNAFLREHGKAQERRVHCHGQGYDMVERPIIRHDETMALEAGMTLSLHPAYATERGYHWICDSFLVGANGPERLHRFPETICEKEV